MRSNLGSAICRKTSRRAAIVMQFLAICATVKAESPVSMPGRYSGYSHPRYQEWVRVSQYVMVRDGTRLAVDIFRPAVEGKPVAEKLPVVWIHHLYHRAGTTHGRLVTELDQSPWLSVLLAHGYVIAVADMRGTGASFGSWQGPVSQREAQDAYDLTEWFAAQEWCNGRIGMYGKSYMGTMQYLAASARPPHLKAIIPEMAPSDLYSLAYPGGVFRSDWAQNAGRLLKSLQSVKPAASVDEDADGSMLFKALREHRMNIDVFNTLSQLPFRDSKYTRTNVRPFLNLSHSHLINLVNGSGVAIYQVAGWYDACVRDELMWYHNLTTPRKIIIGPWTHNGADNFDLTIERLRWFDYWLKGIDNGVTGEPEVRYYTIGAADGEQWRAASKWPLSNQVLTPFYFRGGRSGSVNSTNDGLLSMDVPATDAEEDKYTIDYTTTSGRATRWTQLYGGPFGYGNMLSNDQKAITYTTMPITSDIEVTGHPVVHLWVDSTARDGDFFVYLEKVTSGGNSIYATEGVLRASHRAIARPEFNTMGLPYHASLTKEVVGLNRKPVELVLDLLPISMIFRAGDRIRVSITGADGGNCLTPRRSPPPVITIYRDAKYSSRIILPIIPSTSSKTTTQSSGGPGGAPTRTYIFGLIVLLGALMVVRRLYIYKIGCGLNVKR